MSSKTLTHYLSSIGALASTACAVHCLLTPVVITMLPLLGLGVLAAPWVENLIVGIVIGLGVVSLGHGFHHHRRSHAFWPLVIGVFLLVLARWGTTPLTQLLETSLMVTGGLAVALAHWINRRLCQTCPTCHHLT